MKPLLSLLALLVVLAGLIVFGIWIYRHLTGGAVPIATAILGFIAGTAIQSWKENRRALNDKKREAYVRLLAPWRETLAASVASGKEVMWSKQTTQKLYEAGLDAALYASNDVIRSYGRFLSLGSAGGKTAQELSIHLSALIERMRKDLGRSIFAVDDLEIMATLVPMDIYDARELADRLEPGQR